MGSALAGTGAAAAGLGAMAAGPAAAEVAADTCRSADGPLPVRFARERRILVLISEWGYWGEELVAPVALQDMVNGLTGDGSDFLLSHEGVYLGRSEARRCLALKYFRI